MSVNVLDGNGNLKKIAHGFPESKFNVLRANIIENIELTDTASKNYAVGDYLIMANGQLVKVINAISEDSVITSNDVQATTVEEMIAAKADSADIPDVSKYQKIFTGTTAEWNQLTTDQKTAYDLANITDDLGTEADIVDAVTDGDMRAVTSNAVHDALESKISTSETTGLVKNDGSIDTKSYAEKVANGTENNLAGLDANGNLKDGGWASDKTTTSATGNPISISGLKSNQLAINPIITLEPIQAGSGTPSPSNIRAISGYDKIEVLSCGKNLFDISKVLVGTVSNGLWTWGGSTSKLFDLKFKANTQYTFSGYQTQSGQNKNVRPRIIYTDGTAENIYTSTSTTRTAFTKTSAEDKTIDYIQAYYGSDSRATVTIENFQIEESTSATTYVPYHKTTDLSESLGQTVYWGRLNVRTGKFEVLGIKVICDGSSDENWAEYPSYNGFCFANPSSMLSSNWGSGWSSHFTKLTTHGNIGIRFGAVNTTLYFEQITNNISGVSDVATWRTWLSNNNIEVVYPITPFTIQLTPHEISLLKDYAYVSTNGTSIAFDYHNGELASLSDVVQLSQTVEELDRPQVRFMEEEIVSYSSSSNKYQVPCEGYVEAGVPTGSGYVRVIVYDVAGYTLARFLRTANDITGESFAIYVKKGMQIMVTVSGLSNVSVKFRGMA